MPSNIEIRKISGKRMLKEFIMLPWKTKLYRGDPAWVPAPIRDQWHMFDPARGYFFEHGVVDYFLAYKDGALTGRIAAHTYSRWEEKFDRETGFFGFYECIDDDDVSRALLDTARQWLIEKGKTRMMGP